jgi:hypothetical protein
MAFNQPPSSGWKLLGKLELPVDGPIEGKINVWLMEILHPLNIHEDFYNRILKSAQAVHLDRMTDLESVYLFVYAQPKPPTGQTWGYFRIDKAGIATVNKASSHHSIEFYLYVESR